MNTPITLVIPNWNGKELLKKHLPAVVKTSKNAEIIIVDDASTDDSVSFIEKHYPTIRIVKKNHHDGFASTVNAGVAAATGDIVVLLNTDIVPEEGYLEPLLSHFSHSSVFAVGCLDKSHEKGSIVLRGRGMGWWERGLFLHKRGEVDAADTAWVSGGSGAFRRTIWNTLGGMDTRFDPFYWEDIDLSYRAKEKGYTILFEPKSVVHHYHEEGKIQQEFTKKDITSIVFRNQFYFIWKHATLLQLLQNIFWTPIRICRELLKGNTSMLYGFIRALPELPIIFFTRK